MFCSDVYTPAIEVLEANKGASCKIFGDITSRNKKEIDEFKNIDLYIFTPPCKNYSGLNTNKKIADPHLWETCVDVIAQLKLKMFLYENVQNGSNPTDRENNLKTCSRKLEIWHLTRFITKF